MMGKPVAIVTGAGRGIGAATAKMMADDYDLMLVSRTIDELEKTKSEIEAASDCKVSICSCDISSHQDVAKMFDQLQKDFDRLDVVINNAGYNKTKPLMEMSFEEWQRTMAVNLDGLYHMCRHAIPLLEKQKNACIVNVSSLAGLQGLAKFPGFVAYSAAKAGVIGFSETLAEELKNTNIKVHAFAPGAVNTRMLKESIPDYKTTTQPEDAARKLLELLEEESTGQVLALANQSA